jgi:hypothetical protein
MNLKTKNMTFKKWITELFKDERGSVSIKPVVAFIGALFLCGTMLANSFTEEHFKPAAELVNAVMVITCIGLGADSIDKFSHKKKEEEITNETAE